MKKNIFFKVENDNLSNCNTSDIAAINNLVCLAVSLEILESQTNRKFARHALFMHTMAIINGIASIITAANDRKILALTYIPLLLIFAKGGFLADQDTKHHREEYEQARQNRCELNKILNTSSITELRNIAKTYHNNIPDFQNVTPDIAKTTIRQIVIQHIK